MFILEKHAGNHQCRQVPPVNDEDLGSIPQTCVGRKCMGWRWRPIMVTTAFVNALNRAAEDIGIKPDAMQGTNATKAHKHLRENAEKFGFSFEHVEGFCGYAGEPKANHTERK